MHMNDIHLGSLNGIGVKNFVDFDFWFCNEVQIQGAFPNFDQKKR